METVMRTQKMSTENRDILNLRTPKEDYRNEVRLFQLLASKDTVDTSFAAHQKLRPSLCPASNDTQPRLFSLLVTKPLHARIPSSSVKDEVFMSCERKRQEIKDINITNRFGYYDNSGLFAKKLSAFLAQLQVF